MPRLPPLLALAVLSLLVVLTRGQCPETVPHNCTCEDDEKVYIKCVGSEIKLQEVPSDFPVGTISMKLSNNNIATLSQLQYKEIRRLYLLYNKIKTIEPNAFKMLTKLEILSLIGNDFVSLDTMAFAGLNNLHTLHITQNHQLSKLSPKVFSGDELKSLVYIDLSGNKLSQVNSTWFYKLSSLGEIVLGNNEIRVVEMFSDPHDLPNLRTLLLNHNLITEFISHQFKGLKNLDNLYAAYNQLTSLPSGTFAGLEKTLKTVNVRGNKLSPTLGGALKSLRKLEELDIAENELVWVDAHDINWKGLERIYVHDNPWDCHCRNAWLQHHPLVRKCNVDRVVCSTPEEKKGHSVYEAMAGVDCGSSSHTTVVGLVVAFCVITLLVLISVLVYRRYFSSGRKMRAASANPDTSSRYQRVGENGGQLIM